MDLIFEHTSELPGGLVKIYIALRDSDSICRSGLGCEIAFFTSFHVILMWQVWDLTLRTTVLDHCKPGYTTESPREALRISWLVVPDQLNQNISVGGFWA